jgi:hypothetical protein
MKINNYAPLAQSRLWLTGFSASMAKAFQFDLRSFVSWLNI